MRGLTIRELPDQQKPREKLLQRGVASLTDAEILAILLRTGIRGCNVIELAEKLLDKYGSLAHLSRCPIAELSSFKGIGSVKALHLAAAFGLGTRLAAEQVVSEPLNHPEAIYQLLGTEMRRLDRESLRVVLLDTRFRLIAISEVSKGTLNESLAHPREIFKPAISHSAYAFVLVHNLWGAAHRLCYVERRFMCGDWKPPSKSVTLDSQGWAVGNGLQERGRPS
jgi:DNA repair protein RadC